ncbi:hypothetical protein [Streptomyces sp. NPDC019507]|uniref:hypothetical protein n=1 Tax=Streptomyces sp. NPDC019507 TaxID=3154689 RepID=UPI003404E8E7
MNAADELAQGSGGETSRGLDLRARPPKAMAMADAAGTQDPTTDDPVARRIPP